MNVQERLKLIDPLLKPAISEELTKIWYRDQKIKLYLKDRILRILKEIYNPRGMWTQNPTESTTQIGVIYENEWDPLMQSDTNYTGWLMIFNRCNAYILNLYRIKGIESIEIMGETFSYKNQIQFNKTDSYEETFLKIDKIFKIIEYKKEDIFLIGNPFCEELRSTLRKIMSFGDKSQDFYVKDINYFFDDINSFVASKGRGDKKDMVEGIDVWKTHKDGRKTTDQVKGTCYIESKDNGYLINTGMSQKCRADYYVFVCGQRKIMVFKNDNSKIKFTDDGVFFPSELLYKEKQYNGK